jgi:hypothetical protein
MSKARKQLFCDQTINKANPERNEKEKKEYWEPQVREQLTTY